MKLPNVDRAVIPLGRLTNYLLSRSHPYGRHKAAFFNSLGFSAESRHTFAAALLKHAEDNEVASLEVTVQTEASFPLDAGRSGWG
jgi:hypothetical protein